MSFRNSALISIVCSLGFGGFMVGLACKSIPLKNHGGYAVLTVDASYPDRLIGGLLPPDLARGYIAESTQWVFLDDFGILQQIPLDEYGDRLEDFDPRNDGYAEKLRSFFVRDGKRLFFIPFSGASWKTIPVSDTGINKKQAEAFEAALAAALGDIPFSIEFFGSEQPLLCYFLLFIAAGAGALMLSEAPLFTLTVLPVLGALVFAGPAGLALSTALISLSGVLMSLIRQLCIYRLKGERLGLILGSSLCMILLGLWIAMFWDIPGIFSPAGAGMLGLADQHTLENLGISALISVCGLLVLALWTESNRSRSQVCLRGSPKQRRPNGTVIPFALVSLMALHTPSILVNKTYQEPGPIGDSRYFVDPAEYEKHLTFQRSFSFMPLGLHSESGYAQYMLGEDGLIAKSREPNAQYETPEIPSFPLEDLIVFLKDFKHTNHISLTFGVIMKGLVLIYLLLVLGAYMIIVQITPVTPQKKKKQSLVYNEKRIAA